MTSLTSAPENPLPLERPRSRRAPGGPIIGWLRANLFASVRETVRHLMKEKKYDESATLIQAALRNGQMESWMYEALALAERKGPERVSQGLVLFPPNRHFLR